MQAESKTGRIFGIPSAQEETEIRRAIADDADTHELSDEALRKLRPLGRVDAEKSGQAVSVRLSPDVLAYFKSTGKDWQTLMDNVLKAYVKSQLTKGPERF